MENYRHHIALERLKYRRHVTVSHRTILDDIDKIRESIRFFVSSADGWIRHKNKVHDLYEFFIKRHSLIQLQYKHKWLCYEQHAFHGSSRRLVSTCRHLSLPSIYEIFEKRGNVEMYIALSVGPFAPQMEHRTPFLDACRWHTITIWIDLPWPKCDVITFDVHSISETRIYSLFFFSCQTNRIFHSKKIWNFEQLLSCPEVHQMKILTSIHGAWPDWSVAIWHRSHNTSIYFNSNTQFCKLNLTFANENN